jgi:hypothetical protein
LLVLCDYSANRPSMKFNLTEEFHMSRYKSLLGPFVIAAALLLLQGCSTISRFETATPETTLELRGIPKANLPSDLRLDSKATGQHLFKAASATGQTLYGVLPLRVNGGRMALSIIFFAPALVLGGFRDSYAVYQVDLNAGVLRFKTAKAKDWHLYKPTDAESARAKAYFDVPEPK